MVTRESDWGPAMGKIRTAQFAAAAICLASQCVASPVEAARQGELGAASTGSIEISVSIAPRAQLSEPKEVSFGDAGSMSATQFQYLCLTSTSVGHTFSVSATGSGRADAFELSNGDRTIGYSVTLASPGTDSQQPGMSSVTLHPDSSGGDCKGRAGSGSFVLSIEPSDVPGLQAGAHFTGVLTLVVAPE